MFSVPNTSLVLAIALLAAACASPIDSGAEGSTPPTSLTVIASPSLPTTKPAPPSQNPRTVPPAPGSSPASQSPSATPDPMDAVVEQNRLWAQQLIGLAEVEAEQLTLDSGRKWRVVERDGEFFIITMDFVSNRINAVIKDKVVMSVYVG